MLGKRERKTERHREKKTQNTLQMEVSRKQEERTEEEGGGGALTICSFFSK